MRLTEEQDALRSAVRSLLGRHQGAAAWRPLTEQIGAAGLAVPEEYGGAGGGPLDVHVVMEELGRELSPVPYLGSAVLAVQALLASGDKGACEQLLPGLAEGTTVGCLAWAEHGSWAPEAIRAAAVPGPGGETWHITGTKDHVLHGATADVLLVVARTPEGLALFHVPTAGAGVRRSAVVAMDGTRESARLELDGAEGRLIGSGGGGGGPGAAGGGRGPGALGGPGESRGGGQLLCQIRDLACTALAAEQVGAAARCLELTVAYAKERVQFGRPIGSFQAVKHRLADAFVLVESARSAALGAAFAAAEGSAALSRRAAVAKSACSEAFSTVAGEMIQLHGGIGITWEHDAHRYFKRAHATTHLFGTPAWHRARLAAELGLTT